MSTGFNNILIKLSEIRLQVRFLNPTGCTRANYEKLASDRAGEASEAVRERVLCARDRQLARFNGSDLSCNADTPALAAQVQVWGRGTSANTANWTTPAKR